MKVDDRAQRPEDPTIAKVRQKRRVPPPLDSFNAAKMSRPQMLRAQVSRPRLSAMLDEAVRVPVTLVCAGAGWGKTVLVSTWAESQSFPVAWLTVDAGDNDVRSFWSYVVRALRRVGAVRADNPLAELQTVPTDDGERLRALTVGLRRLSGPVVVVVDDFHEIDDLKVLRELRTLLDHPPPGLHLILLGRSDPALPLYRLRLAGALGEIRAEDLAFTAEEAALLLARPPLDLDEDDVGALLDRTEGWPAGLQMAAAFLAGPGARRVDDFTGDVRSVDEYLANEILARQPAGVVRFLLYTSICDHVCGELAGALTGEADGQRILEGLELVNDFVLRLGTKPQWFRYHHLLRDALRHRLLLRDAGSVPELHMQAARWYAANGSIFEALGHAVAGADWDYVGRLVVNQGAPLILSADRAALMKALRSVPAMASTSTAELMVCSILQMFDAGDWDAMHERLAQVREMLRGDRDHERPRLEILLGALEMSVSRAVGDMPAVVTRSTRLLTMLREIRPAEVPAAAQYRAVALNNKGVGLLWQGRAEAAERFLWSASTAARAAGVELAEINAVGHLALLEVMSGSVREAARLAGEARDLAERRGWKHALQSVAAHLGMVLVHLERNELSQAERVLDQARRARRNGREATQRPLWLGCQAKLALARGEPGGARALLSQARSHRDARIRAPAIGRWLLLIESQLDLQTGRPEVVEARYAQAAEEAPLSYAERVRRAQAAFEMQDFRRAEALLAEPQPLLSETVATVEAHILTALIADARGQGLRAVDALTGAVALAEREGVRRPFLTAGSGHLERLVSRQSLFTQRYAAFAADVLREMTSTGPQAQAAGATDLSEREQEVLRYLPTMLTAGDIAVELGVSVNTVKAHLRSIYRKLDVSHRREAVAQARERALL